MIRRAAWSGPVRRARLARDVLYDGDGTLAHERDRHRMGAHAVARDSAGGVGGVDADAARDVSRVESSPLVGGANGTRSLADRC
jgi:hypothetical protein